MQFKSLQKMKTKGARVWGKWHMNNNPEEARPKPNLRPPGHSEWIFYDYASKYLENDPMNRHGKDVERRAVLADGGCAAAGGAREQGGGQAEGARGAYGSRQRRGGG